MINTDRKALVDRLGRREFWGELFGWMVGVGLVVEYWQEIVDCFTKRQLPPLPLVGGLVVTLGVLGEVWFSRLASKTAEEISERADSDVAQANERAAEALKAVSRADLNIAELNTETERLRKETADANLARAKIEQRMSVRSFTADDFNKLITLLKPHSPKLVDIVVYDHHIPETKVFAGQLSFVFISAGWHCHMYESRAAKARISGPSVIVAVALDHEGDNAALASTLASAINRPEIDCAVRLGSFGFAMGKEFNPGEFQLTLVHPFRAWGATILSPLRVQIGAKQIASYPSSKTAIVLAGVGAPPQT
jgi:hypothetical protein